MKRIKLTQGKFALVSDIDYTYLNQWKWYAHKDHNTYYAVRCVRDGLKFTTIQMHKVILIRIGHKYFKGTDHKDRDGLNNQRRNLRPATHTQNGQNRTIKQTNNTSGYRGVNWSKSNVAWQTRIQFNGRRIHVGYFTNKIEAAKEYNRVAEKYFGKFARLNTI